MRPRKHPDAIHVSFDDHRPVVNAGLLLPASLGLGELADQHVDLGDAPGRANTGDKLLTLVASALAGGDCIDEADALRSVSTGRVMGCMVGVPPISCGRRWAGCVMPGPGVNSRCGPTADSTPIPSSPTAAGWVSASPSPWPARPVAPAHGGHSRGGLEVHSYRMEGASNAAWLPFR